MVGVNRNLEVTGSLSGSFPLNIKSGATAPAAGQAAGQVVLKSDSSSYTGTLTVNSNAWLDLDHDNAVAGAAVVVEDGSMVRRAGTDANGTTTAASWAITGRGNLLGTDATRGAIYFNQNGLAANLVGNIAISGTQSRIGTYSGGRQPLAIDGNITGSGNPRVLGRRRRGKPHPDIHPQRRLHHQRPNRRDLRWRSPNPPCVRRRRPSRHQQETPPERDLGQPPRMAPVFSST